MELTCSVCFQPRNIFLHGPNQQVKIGDFGLACADIIQNTDWANGNGKSKFVLVVVFVWFCIKKRERETWLNTVSI